MMKFVSIFTLLLVVTNAQTAWFNGLNVPWNHFGYDIGAGSFDQQWFETFFSTCSQNHVNSARFWVHCDGRATPNFNSNGLVTGLSSTFISELIQLTDMAASHNVVLILTLWSFDMCKQETPTGYHPQLLNDTSATKSYIDNALIPILKAMNNYTNIVWEVINEPEWCIKETPGNTPYMATLKQMQAFVGAIAEAVHRNSHQTVTVGSASLKWNSDANPPAVGNWWSDKAIQSAYPSSDAKLDFYQIHYYDWMHNNDWGYDPCREPASYWKLDKPTIVGELPATGGSYYTPIQLMTTSLQNNFWGTAFWSYNADFDWHKDIDAWNTFYSQHSSISSYETLTHWLSSLR
eukprot:TRINITY_DN10655_c0_g1_i1.p1 TRINITY_DN10655_c0_g1~~TRINITY_DN10655_c0_g1_i1.p1  ORF type:complete len:348 (+),score=58.93 TRINITY_DN10655_c0_g1_i1:112-1155(+)